MTTFTTVEPEPELCARYRAEGWWSGETLRDLLASALHSSRERVFAVHSRDGMHRMSLRDVADLGRRVGTGLRRLGIVPGDPVAFQLSNSVEAAAVFYGLVHAGAVLVPISHAAGSSYVTHALRTSQARAVIIESPRGDGAIVEEITSRHWQLEKLEHLFVVGDGAKPSAAIGFGTLTASEAEHNQIRLDPAAPAVIGWTSGSTATPKGVLLSHRALCAEIRQHMAPLLAERTRGLLSTSPVSHVTGMLVSLLVPPLAGHDVHLMDYWDAGDVLELMQTHALAAGSGAPLFLQSLLDDPRCTPEHHRLIDVAALGGAAVTRELIERADALGVTAVKGYGCTVHPSISLGNSADPLLVRAATDGHLCTGVDVRIRDERGSHHRTGTGEIITRGPDLFSGYVDPAMNTGAFDQGWYRTGDIGSVDERGYVTVLDRLKDIIIRSGLNVSASEVEAALASMPEVADVAVVAAPDTRTGEHGCAFIRPAAGHGVPSLPRIREHLITLGLAKYKWPEEIRARFTDFPRTPAGKVRKSALRKMARQSPARDGT
ncbi:MAG: fadK 5 [Pseudonocardiales bacterium]|nr:fadK 5 [Pseudonocardiales bacterium]